MLKLEIIEFDQFRCRVGCLHEQLRIALEQAESALVCRLDGEN